MMGEVVHINRQRAAEDAWERYRQHRLAETYRPSLADDPKHIAEAARLHKRFVELSDGRPLDEVVVPIGGRG